jgi:hypothetical protein
METLLPEVHPMPQSPSVDILSERELDYLWRLMRGYAAGNRAEFMTTLREMVAACRISMMVTTQRVEVKMPFTMISFERPPSC